MCIQLSYSNRLLHDVNINTMAKLYQNSYMQSILLHNDSTIISASCEILHFWSNYIPSTYNYIIQMYCHMQPKLYKIEYYKSTV